MKQNKLRIIVISCLLITSFLLSGTAYAQDEELPDPGITPDSPFYFLDTLGKNVGMFFTFGPEAKARKALQYAEERLAEVQVMAAKNRVRALTRAANDYDGFMAMVNERAEEARQRGIPDNVSETVALATSKHLSVLDRIKDQVPEEASEATAQVRTASMNGQKNALRALAKIKPERAFEINSATIESRLNRARVKATENVTAEVDEALEDAAEFLETEEEILEIAREHGKDISAIEQQLAQSTSNRFEVLSQVYEKVPEQAKPAIANAMENTVRKYEREIEKIAENSASGEIPEEARELQRTQEELRERLRLMTTSQAQVSDTTSGNVTEQARIRVQVQEKVREPVSNLKPETSELAASANKTRGNKEDANQEKTNGRSP